MDRPTDRLSFGEPELHAERGSEAAREGGREIVELSERAGQSVGGAPKSICLSSLANSLACSLTELFVPLTKFEKSIDLVQCITLISCKVIHYFHIICQYLNVSVPIRCVFARKRLSTRRGIKWMPLYWGASRQQNNASLDDVR